MFGLHLPDLIIILAIGLAILGPKTIQSLSRNAGKGVSQAKSVKDKVLSELPVEEFTEAVQKIPRIPTSPTQAIQMLLTTEQPKKQETKNE